MIYFSFLFFADYHVAAMFFIHCLTAKSAHSVSAFAFCIGNKEHDYNDTDQDQYYRKDYKDNLKKKIEKANEELKGLEYEYKTN